MSQFHSIPVENLPADPFTMIGKDWMLVSAMKDGKINTMTASWGGMGILWGKKVVFVFIRPQRYTKAFTDASDYMTLSFYDESHRDALRYFGTVSGRDEDKIANMQFHPIVEGEYAYFEEASHVLVCRKLYAQDMNKESFVLPEIADAHYKSNDFHTMYIAEVVDVLAR